MRTIIQTETEEELPRVSVAETDVSVLDTLALLARRKTFITRFVVISTVLATVVAFLLPVRYEAKIVLLPPQQNSSIASAVLGQMGGLGSLGSLGSLASLGGLGMKNTADMYVSFFTSRTVEDAMIRRFGLMAEYKEKNMTETRKVFERNTSVVAGNKDGLIRIAVDDRDPKRAAEMANGYVEEFRRLSATLAISEAARRRVFFEGQLQQAKADLAAAEEAMRKTQQSTGVLQIDSQARALIESSALLRAQVVAKEVQVQSMRAYAAEDNPTLVMAKQELAALKSQLEQLAGSQHDDGSDIVLSKGRVTGEGMEYLRRYRDLKYHETTYELLAKELEIAKLDEAREGEIVQVVDAAVPPDKRSSPHRTLIILGSMILSFFAAVVWIKVREGMALSLELPENQRRLRAIKAGWNGRPSKS